MVHPERGQVAEGVGDLARSSNHGAERQRRRVGDRDDQTVEPEARARGHRWHVHPRRLLQRARPVRRGCRRMGPFGPRAEERARSVRRRPSRSSSPVDQLDPVVLVRRPTGAPTPVVRERGARRAGRCRRVRRRARGVRASVSRCAAITASGVGRRRGRRAARPVSGRRDGLRSRSSRACAYQRMRLVGGELLEGAVAGELGVVDRLGAVGGLDGGAQW